MINLKKGLILIAVLSIANLLNGQAFMKEDVIGKYEFKVNWMISVETSFQIRKSGEYKLIEIHDGNIRKEKGSWKIVDDKLLLIPEPSEVKTRQREISIWVDELGIVHLGSYVRMK